MVDTQAGHTEQRAVVLWPQGAPRPNVAGEGADGLALVFVPSPYEAAAELIAEPALALVIDLRLMGRRHLRLLRIARERGAEMLAVGAVPAGLSAEDLSGIRLVARADLKAALEGLLHDREGRYEPSQAAPVLTERAEADEPAPAHSVKAAATRAHSPKAASQKATPARDESSEELVATAPPAPESPSGPPAGGLRGILTADELTALLGKQP